MIAVRVGAPMVLNKPAQGNALGNSIGKEPSPERAQQFVPPLQGFDPFWCDTQGVALGWLVAGPLALGIGGAAHIFHSETGHMNDAVKTAKYAKNAKENN